MPPRRVALPISIQDWDFVSFLHWRVDAARLRPMLPDRLELDTFDGTAWLGLVPFRILMRVGPFAVPGSRYPETNVRTYVTGPDGKRGLWFLSLDVSRAIVVAAARLSVGLPYRWSRMRVEHRGEAVRYAASRILPPGARSLVEVRPGGRLPARDVGELEDFLTARYCLYSAYPLGLLRVDVEHPAWELHEGSATIVDDGLVSAAGVSLGEDTPLVHTSPGVRVRVGPPVPA